MGSVDKSSNGESPPVVAHVALLAFPFGTHAAPLFSLARALVAAAPPNVFFSFHGSAHANVPLKAAASTLPNLKLYEAADGVVEGGPPVHPEVEVGRFLDLTPGNFRETIAAAEKDAGVKITCVVADGFLWFAEELAEHAGATWISVWTGGPASLSSHVYTDLLRDKIGTGDQEISEKLDEKLGFIPGFSDLRVRDLPEGVVSGNLNSSFAQMLHAMGTGLHRATAVVINTFEGLDEVFDSDFNSKFKITLPIGPLHLLSPSPSKPHDDHGCLSWLDSRDPSSVAYISFGSIFIPSLEKLQAIANGLEESGVPFLWSLKERARGNLPEGFIEKTRNRGMVVPWAPQVAVLHHPAVGAFMTHCGWNSVIEGIAGGVPMISFPFLGDQMLNARVISHVWKIGVGFDGIVTKESMAGNLKKVLKDEEGKKMKARVEEIKVKAKAATVSGGSSAENFNRLVKLITS